MLLPTYVDLQGRFYPIGSTPAVNLFREFRPKRNSKVRALLLECGDPRSILFSFWHEAAYNEHCIFEIITCDSEPAVLARNVVLFTFILDNIHVGQPSSIVAKQSRILWDLFYHLYIPPAEIDILHNHTSILVESSGSIDLWSSSSYGKLIHFSNSDTLLELRKIWISYTDTRALAGADLQTFETYPRAAITATWHNRFAVEENEQSMYIHGLRSAGGHTRDALITMSLAFEKYWDTGVAGGNYDDMLALGTDGKGRVNPMFAISSGPTKTFSVHDGSDPLLGFLLPDALDDTDIYSNRVFEAVLSAKIQFQKWCSSFAEYLQRDCVRIIIHCGEAINLCHELQHLQNGGQSIPSYARRYKGPWKSKPLNLAFLTRGSAMERFDIIDTSNLVDHVGILNILPAVAPLLNRSPCSVLYTESLLLVSQDTSKILPALLLSDVTTASLIVGLAPVGYLLGSATDSIGDEVFTFCAFPGQPGQQQQFRLRIPWKVAAFGDREALKKASSDSFTTREIKFDYDQLAKYFFALYLRMFAFEDLSETVSNMDRRVKDPVASNLRPYTRLSFVVFLHLASKNVITDWPRCMESLLNRVENDRSLMLGTNSLQELYMHLHMFGLSGSFALGQSPRELSTTVYGAIRSTSSETGLLQKYSLPSIVYLALVVPRDKLIIFTKSNPDGFEASRLRISILQEAAQGFENYFFSIDCFFGKLKPRSDKDGFCDVEEDVGGWTGQGDLIVTCPVPTYTLLIGPRIGIKVRLVVNTSPLLSDYVEKIGTTLKIFECGLADEKHLYFLRKAPGIQRDETELLRKSRIISTTDQSRFPRVDLNHDGTTKCMTIRTQFPQNSPEGDALQQGAAVVIAQPTPCCLSLRVGDLSVHTLAYPYPIDGSASKSQIAQKQAWVEVMAPPSPALVRGGHDLDPFPIVIQDSQLVPWGISRVDICKQPIVPVSSKVDWLHDHVGMSLNTAQRLTYEGKGKKQAIEGISLVLETLHCMFMSFVGRNAHSKFLFRCFVLYDVEKKESDTLIIVNALRHDRVSGSVCLDAFLVPYTEARKAEMKEAMASLAAHEHEVLTVRVSDEENRLWKRLFPALVERCRYDWDHTSTCEYVCDDDEREGEGGGELGRRWRIPLSTAYGERSICSCGEGRVGADAFPRDFRAFEGYATRMAGAVEWGDYCGGGGGGGEEEEEEAKGGGSWW
ncbi:hypothetical protein MMC06_004131 [Schaereria dolodes]|nr:hypothetical protein [Schaereria dolodes]